MSGTIEPGTPEHANQANDIGDARVLKSRMRVTAIADGWIELQGDRTASCSACAAKSGCGIKGLSDLTQQSPLRFSAPTAVAATPAKPVHAIPANGDLTTENLGAGVLAAGRPAVGDEVVVSLSGDEFLQLAMLAYLLPAAALAATTCLAALAGLGDMTTAFLALSAFAISFLPLRWRERSGSGLTSFAIAEPRQAPDDRL